ncbi:type VI secretion system tip protein VgrG [Gilliamella sp. B14448G11]|uniref:type VI secretion system Vgr family protein n=1 Tax=unclassified Gilliamella TaxID=2685620 RepID=UPI0018DCAB81|nr:MULTISPECIES: type VI secretion system Vgr family protein [unclassified Gilliamella]MBI0027269.1 type VI secretion system tip protein VgrG [Gilliamella sp. B14448G7]MBI0034090.1 type VI secretion system tip protein VgrG [Gilliamella sp. B14448G11]MBI0041825.1 type VI secretion system tip protein VgrG [Gilliamella sp. B14448G12]
MSTMEQLGDSLTSLSGHLSHNNYSLSVDGSDALSNISVVSIKGQERLNEPWQYQIDFTSEDKQISIASMLSQAASLTFHPNQSPLQVTQISSFDHVAKTRKLYGIITEFSLVSISEDEARYRVKLEPRMALLANHHQSAIFQNKSVIDVVDEVLRNHNFIGIDFRFELKETYPVREFITQWQESDLNFIQRLLADVGLYFYFETHPEHHCDVIVISDYEKGYADGGKVTIKQPSGLNDRLRYSVWDLQFSSKTKPSQVSVNDYNYRMSDSNLYSSDNSQPKDMTMRGEDYRYEEHHKTQGDIQTVESGNWYARIRHQHYVSEQFILTGQCNVYELIPGQLVIIEGCPIAEIKDGVVIVATECYGDRTESYQTRFTAIPYDVLKPYRPAPLPWPQVSGTLPARVTSKDDDTYGYIDTQGRYRIKFNFDLKNWQKGEESLWVRLAKPYAGDTYGFHFPLIDSTEVAIAFTNGNPDRPYIAHAMHDSSHPDHVTTINKHRNVIRTPANNKLRMDDKRGQEHIKLATEYGKTQLNLGHLVDSEKTKRGEGFELRTDEWGAISAEKGIYITTETESKAKGKQLDMEGTKIQLSNALSIVQSLQKVVENSNAHSADIESQTELKNTLTQLNESGIVGYAQEGIGLTSPKNIQLSTGKNISIIAENNTEISVIKKITLAAGEALSFFAHKMGIKLFASKGKVEIQAQNDELSLMAKDEIQINSIDNSVTLTAPRDITLISGGSYIKINGQGIELGTPGNVVIKSAALQKMGPASMNVSTQEVHFMDMPPISLCVECLKRAARNANTMLEIN